MAGGYAGGQAGYARVPFADVGAFPVPDGIDGDRLLLLTDHFPTGWMAVEACGIRPGDTVAIRRCGPVGPFAIRSSS